jgi:thiaminase (transcriptional activator TenA)
MPPCAPSPPQFLVAINERFEARAARDGSLPRSVFLHFLRQEQVVSSCTLPALGLSLWPRQDIGGQASAVTVHALVHHEMQPHIETCAGEGISQAELEATAEAAENLARPRFVLEAGYSGD